MAAGKPLIFTQMRIEDAGGGNAANYQLVPVDARTLGVEPIEEMVDDGQTITHGFNGSFEVKTYDDAVMSDARVSVSATVVAPARLVMVGASGGTTVTFTAVRINARQSFDGDRLGFIVKATKTTTAQPFTTA